jgi:hypothetical protein
VCEGAVVHPCANEGVEQIDATPSVVTTVRIRE